MSSIDNPYQAPLSDLVAPPKDLALDRTYGGIGRGMYFGLGFLVWIGSVILTILVGLVSPENYMIGSLSISLAQITGMVYLSGQRIKNLGQNPWWGLALLIPLYGLIVMIRCLAYPEGWSDHRTLDQTGKVIGGLIALAFILPIVAVIALVAAG